MQRLSKQDYEAIAIYDCEKNPGSRAAVVIEPSYGSVALCVHTEKGKCEVANLWNSNSDMICFEDEIKSVYDYKVSETEIKDAVRRYYLTNKGVDSTVAGTGKKASEIMEHFNAGIGNTLNVFFDSADAALADMGMDSKNLRVLFVGNMAQFFPAEVVARLHYSPAMPMMPDSRYGFYEDTAAIVELGNAIIEENRTKHIDGPVEWLVLKRNSEGTPDKLKLLIADDGEKADDLKTPKYTPAVFACSGNELEVSIAGAVRNFTVPDGLLPGGMGMIRLGLQCEDEVFFLIVDANDKSERFPVNIKIKGE